MMYDPEKSDSAIVAVKPTNKAGQPAAELVEPRAEAEGNVGQQSTGRAQHRGTVSQALERIRQVARQRKKEKFTALFHHGDEGGLGLLSNPMGRNRVKPEQASKVLMRMPTLRSFGEGHTCGE